MCHRALMLAKQTASLGALEIGIAQAKDAGRNANPERSVDNGGHSDSYSGKAPGWSAESARAQQRQ